MSVYINSRLIQVLAIALITLLSACGGGSSGGNSSTAQRVVFTAEDPLQPGPTQLYSVFDDGSSLTRLSSNQSVSWGVLNFKISPDKQWVAYEADHDADRVEELYVVPISGGTVVKVSGALVAFADVRTYQWSPDSTQIVFEADRDLDDASEIYLVNRDGSDLIKINGGIGGGPTVEVHNPVWSPDGRYIVQNVCLPAGGAFEAINMYDSLGVVGNSERIVTATNNTSSCSLTTNHPQWSSDSALIAYRLDQGTAGVFELYTATPDGGTVTKVHPNLPNGRRVDDWQWAPDGTHIGYIADQTTDNFFELYTNTPDGLANIRVNLRTAGSIGSIFNLAPWWSPDGSKIAYIHDQDTSGANELYVSDADGSNNTRVNQALSSDIQDVGNFSWAPDNTHLTYTADIDTDDVSELYVGAADGTSNNKINSPSPTILISDDKWSPDGSHIAYQAGDTSNFNWELFVSSRNGSTNGRIHSALNGTQTVDSHIWSPNSARVSFLIDQTGGGDLELFANSRSGGQLQKLSGSLLFVDDFSYGPN